MLSQEILGSNKAKEKREEELGRFGCVGIAASFARRAAKIPKSGFRWLCRQNSNYSNRKQCSTYKGEKNEWLALSFRRKQSRMLGRKESKRTENCCENTDFDYATIPRAGHMPSQLPARLSGLFSHDLLLRNFYQFLLKVRSLPTRYHSCLYPKSNRTIFFSCLKMA